MHCTDESGDMVPSEKEAQLKKEAVAWVIRLHRGDLSPEDRRAFDAWHAQSPAHTHMFQKVFRVWDSPELRAAATVAAETRSSIFSATPNRSLRWSILAAACVAMSVIGVGHLATCWQADYRTGAGERRTVELPDRSVVTLNTQSAIALSFDGTARRVRLLSGEAFFTVQHDTARPFVVEGTEATVRAVGTAFVVRAKASGERITVLEGTVEVDSKGETISPVSVTAGSQIQMENGHLGPAYPVNVPTASAWLQGRLVVNGVPFASVLDELRRYHPGMIILWNQAVAETKVTGTYNVDDPVAALKLLVKTVPISMIGLADRLILLF
jgi:transmembrane sensor